MCPGFDKFNLKHIVMEFFDVILLFIGMAIGTLVGNFKFNWLRRKKFQHPNETPKVSTNEDSENVCKHKRNKYAGKLLKCDDCGIVYKA